MLVRIRTEKKQKVIEMNKKISSILIISVLFLSILPVMTAASFAFDINRGNGKWAEDPTPEAQVLDWGYVRIGAEAARAAATGVVQVAVLDTGVDTDHPDLAGVVTWCVDVIDNVSCEDEDGHGTHTTGTIAALDNEIGIVGAAAGHVEMYMLKVLGRSGGDWYDLGTAIRMAADGPDGIEGNADDAEVISMSLGGDISSAPEIIDMLQDAIDYAWNAGTVIVSSAGNEGDGDSTTIEPAWPAMNDHVIAVGATGIYYDGSFVTEYTGAEEDAFVSFSNSGPYLDIAAPGVYITSLAPGGGTAVMSGTSMSCPYVAAFVALIMGNNPGISPLEVESILYGNALDIGYPLWTQGAGLLQA